MTLTQPANTESAGRGARTARAARYYGVGDIRIEDIEVPRPAAGEVTVEVAFVGICGSDLHEYFAAQTVTPVAPHPLTGATLPVVLGHEFSGVVVEVGSGVDAVAPGARVAVRPTYTCGTCPGCRRGVPNTCVQLAFHGLSANGGGLSTYTTVRADMVFELPEHVSLQHGALVEPMAVSLHGVALGLRQAGESAFVGGAGPIGLGAMFALRALGAGHVTVSDISPVRRDLAMSLGADEVFDPATTTLQEVLGERILDVAIDAAGAGPVVTSAVSALGPRGRLVVVGIHERPMQFEPISLLYREVQMLGSSIYTDDDFRAVIDAMAKDQYPLDGWISVRRMDEIHAVFDELRSGAAAKILIDVQSI